MLGRARLGRDSWAKSRSASSGGEVDVSEDHDPGRRVLEDLRPPARLSPRVEPFPGLESERLEHRDQSREEPPGRSVGVVVVVRPAQTETILPGLLDPRREVPRLPVIPLDLENQVAGEVAVPRQIDDSGEGRFGGEEPFGVIIKPSLTPLPEFAGGERPPGGLGGHPANSRHLARKRVESGKSPALYDGQARRSPVDPANSVWAARVAEDLQAEVMSPRKCRDRLDLDRDLGDPRRGPQDDDKTREHPPVVDEQRRAGGVIRRLADVPQVPQLRREPLRLADDEVVDPVAKPGARLGQHSRRKLIGEGVTFESLGDLRVDERLGLGEEFPVESPWRSFVEVGRHQSLRC